MTARCFSSADHARPGVVGRGFTAPLPPPVKMPRKAPTPSCPRPSCPITGPAHTGSYPAAPSPPSTSSQHRQVNRIYRQMSIGAAHRGLSRSRDECLSPLDTASSRTHTLRLRRSSSSAFPQVLTSGTRPATASGGSEKLLTKPRPGPLRLAPTSSGS